MEYKLIQPLMNFSQPKLNLSDIKENFNGWSDWTTWNVALWINNDEGFTTLPKSANNYADFLMRCSI